MSEAEIIAELPKLDAQAREHVFQRLCELQEGDLLEGKGPSVEDKLILDEAMAEYEKDGDAGMPWREAIHEIRAKRAS